MTTGLLRPFMRDQKTGFALGSGDALVADRIGAIVAACGEVPWKPELDSRVDRLRNQRNTPMLAQMATVYIQEAVGKFEPGVVGIEVDAEQDEISITLTVTGQKADRTVQALVTL